RKGFHKFAGGVDPVKLNDGLLDRVSESEQLASLRMTTVVCAEADWFGGARPPFAHGIELHGQFVACRRLAKGEQMAAVTKYADEGAVLERPGIAVRADKCRIDRHRLHDAAIDGTLGASLGGEATGLDEAVAVAGAAVVEIDGVDHSVAVHGVGKRDWPKERVGSVAHIGAAEFRRDAACDHRQVSGIDFRSDRGEVAAEMRIIRDPGDLRGLQSLYDISGHRVLLSTLRNPVVDYLITEIFQSAAAPHVARCRKELGSQCGGFDVPPSIAAGHS